MVFKFFIVFKKSMPLVTAAFIVNVCGVYTHVHVPGTAPIFLKIMKYIYGGWKVVLETSMVVGDE